MQLSLHWHYRSCHEHLITFSNRKYYENRLLTFPGSFPDDPRRGVVFHHVPRGVFDREASRTNRPEAEAVVAELVSRLRDPLEQKRTCCVVTFNQPQQTLILDLQEQACRNFPDIESLVHRPEEPVFVKNLENVQGDERDVIFSPSALARTPRDGSSRTSARSTGKAASAA